MAQTARHIIFVGHVQGVGFRFTARSIARRFNLSGYVRNLPNGDVEMFAQGVTENIAGCIREIENYFSGYIRDTRAEDVPFDPRYTEFNITF